MNLPPIPPLVRRAISLLPQYPASAAAAVALTLCMGEHLGAAAQPELADKLIRMHIIDAGITMSFRVRPEGFSPVANGAPDLTLSATAADFLALALHSEDADTLFFSRRLVMEGDTELGLFVKNTLDALDMRPTLPGPRDFARLLRSLRM